MAHHTGAAALLAAAAVLLGLQSILLCWKHPRDIVWYAKLAGIGCGEWIISVLIQRLVFHPLAKYPGPLLAALTDWYVVFWIVQGGRHLEIHRLHQKHGKFVRYGPSRLAINSVQASKDLYDVKANAVKSDAYGAAKFFFGGAEMSTTIRDHKGHAFRRRVNVAAMTPASVRGYEALATPHIDYFLELMGDGSGTKSDGEKGWSTGRDMSLAVAYCIADIMGSVTFNRSWYTQREKTYRHFVKDSPLGVAGMHLLGHMQSILKTQLHRILFMPLVNGVNELKAVSRAYALWRIKQTDVPYRDIWSSLITSKDPETGSGFTEEVLISEACLFIVAGTDTTITGLSEILFYLMKNPRVLERLTKEIREHFPLQASDHGRRGRDVECPIRWGSPELHQIPYLQACIDEAMRLSPPLAGVLPREVGEGGMVVDGEFFPAGVNLAINTYSLHHDERNFEQALSYVPERFLPASEKAGAVPSIKEPAAFAPFGIGRTSCIGKHLAYQEMFVILARMLWLFDLRQEPGNNKGGGTGNALEGRKCSTEYQLRDHYVSAQDGPVVQFRYREEVKA